MNATPAHGRDPWKILLLEESPLLVRPGLAKLLGLNEAIVLQQLQFVLTHFESRVVELEGISWVQGDLSYWREEHFPFFSESTLKRTFANLRDRRVVRTKRGSEANVYSIDYDALSALVTGHIDPSQGSDRPLAGGQSDPSLLRGEELQREEGETASVGSADDDTSIMAIPGLESAPAGQKDEKPEPKADTMAAIHEVWDHFVTTFDPPQKNLSPSRSRLIGKALNETWNPEVPRQAIETCKRAIDGLKSWRQERRGDETISAVFATRPGGSALGDQIQFFVSKAGSEPVIAASVPSVHRDRIIRRRIQVTEMYANPDAGEGARERGEAALEWLKEHAKEVPVLENGHVVGWRAA